MIYEIGTYGGILQSGDDISKYFILDVGKKAHTVAYITTEAISAGAMISVSCQDIIMIENATIGDCAPISFGGKLEGVEREKTESFTRAAFDRAAESNGYPQALLRSMVTMQIEVHKIKNLETGQYEFFESVRLPKDPNKYDITNKELIVKSRTIREHIEDKDVAEVFDILIDKIGLAVHEAAEITVVTDDHIDSAGFYIKHFKLLTKGLEDIRKQLVNPVPVFLVTC